MVNWNDILTHFKRSDIRIASLLLHTELEYIIPGSPDTYYRCLCGSIIGQQLSGSVSDVIESRFIALFPNKQVTPEWCVTLSDESIRSVGISNAKVQYIKDLTRRVLDGDVNLPVLTTMDDADVIKSLTKIYGIGPWTAEMFLIFTLGRPDVFSFGDLGLKHAIQSVYALKKEPSVGYMKRLAKRWSPYRSYAARVLWKYKDGATIESI